VIGAICSSHGPVIPLEISEKIEIRATYALSKHEAFLFSESLIGIVQQLINEGIHFKNLE